MNKELISLDSSEMICKITDDVKGIVSKNYDGPHYEELVKECVYNIIKQYNVHISVENPIESLYGYSVSVCRGIIKQYEENEFKEKISEYL